jgi:hypothetical protein
VTDSHGLISSLQAAYKVADDFDVTAPGVKILSPANGARVALPASHQITISGVFTEETDIDTVLVNGEAAQVSGATWTATVTATLGSNMIQAVALDAAGNASAPDLVDVIAEPAFGVDFTVTPAVAAVNSVVAYTAVITAGEAMTATVLFPFSVEAVDPSNGSATTGLLDLQSPVSWEGVVAPGQPVTIQWQGVATEPISRTISALVQREQTLPRFSQDVSTQITGAPLGVTLASFEAQVRPDHLLVIWETNTEIDNRGFNLYRSTSAAGPERQLNATLIPSQSPGNAGGFVYTWEDRADLQAGTTYFYWLDDVDFTGSATRHGPVSVEFSIPTAVQVSGFSASSAPDSGPSMAGMLPALLVLLAAAFVAVRRLRM